MNLHRFPALPGLVAVHFAAYTPPAAAQEPVVAEFEAVFREVGRIVIREPADAPITGIEVLQPLPDGRLVVVDRRGVQITVHAADGAFLRTVGREGEGPGEMQRPLDVAVDAAGAL